jgi:hypothetical protein
MSLYPFTVSELKSLVNTRIHNKIGLIADVRGSLNNAVNLAVDKFRSQKRRSPLAPNLFNDIYQYAAPSDIEANNLIGIQPQSGDRSRNNIWEYVSEEEFDIRKQSDTNLVAFADHTFLKTLLISSYNGSLKELSIAGLQGLTGDSASGASWAAFGNATNLQTDTFNFIKGNGSLQFNLSAGGTTAGVVLTTVNTFDLTSYANAGSVFSWVYIATVADVTNVKLRLGNNAGNYYELTATTPNDGTSFVNGWNLVRFDFNSKTTQGSPVQTTCAYAALFFTLSGAALTTAGYRFNWLNAKQGQISNLVYYGTYLFQSVIGTYLNKSTLDTDYIVCDHDEFPMIVEKAVEVLGNAAREYQDAALAKTNYDTMIKAYKRQNPTETLSMVQTYHYMDRGVNRNDSKSNIWLR